MTEEALKARPTVCWQCLNCMNGCVLVVQVCGNAEPEGCLFEPGNLERANWIQHG